MDADRDTVIEQYKLTCELIGHSLDVRAVAGSKDLIISGSRDKTVKVWKKRGQKYEEDRTYTDHTNFVSSVLYLDDVDWICTGSNDSTICVYKEGALAPFVILKGHTNTVCALAKGLKSKVIISGSWDQTARIWRIDDNGTSTFISLVGHDAAVWAVTTVGENKYVTGSADKTIIYWSRIGEQLMILKGHQDCVRGLIGMKDGTLISCGNDAVIKLWDDNGECEREFHGHSNYIYTIALNSHLGDDVIVSGGEDSVVRMWNLLIGNMGDGLDMPAQSIWSIACLKNGDIVTGTSDGVVRVFTKDHKRYADGATIHSFNLAVQKRKLQDREKLGGIKRNDLPGPELLLHPGIEGQTTMIKEADGRIACYQWENGKWSFIGDVMGASGGTQQSSGKTLYEGKEYDYVFNVDISDSFQPIKLPYNREEDPWLAAQEFIQKNNLPQTYLDQVANFIIKNSDTPVIGPMNNELEDPFTGGSRYIPGFNINNYRAGENLDPFTGSSSYSTSTTRYDLNIQTKHFPQITYVTFYNCDPSKILEKLKEFNKTAELINIGASEDTMLAAIKLTQKELVMEKASVDALLHLLRWPLDIYFPVLDIARLAVRNEDICFVLVGTSIMVVLIDNLLKSPANKLMAIRCLANMLIHENGRRAIKLQLSEVIENLNKTNEGSSNLQIAIATFYLNLTVSQLSDSNEKICVMIINGIVEFLKWCTDLEAYYRSMQALGNLSCTPFGSIMSAKIISTDCILEKITEFSKSQQATGFEKLTECATEVLGTF